MSIRVKTVLRSLGPLVCLVMAAMLLQSTSLDRRAGIPLAISGLLLVGGVVNALGLTRVVRRRRAARNGKACSQCIIGALAPVSRSLSAAPSRESNASPGSRTLEADLRRAVAEGQFEVFYQPIISLRTGAFSGAEALLRWRHPERGMIPPSDFIPIAERTGLIRPLGLWVLNRACADAMTWPSHVKIAVNLSPAQFCDEGFVEQIIDALHTSGLPAHRLELEITETMLLQDDASLLSALHELRAHGVQFALDDFGTGYSSLSYLRRFPFNKIKIDQSFVRNLSEQVDCAAIVRAVIGLGRSLNIAVTAEGVETEAQLAFLREEGCTQVQGYLFSRPRPLAEVSPLIGSYVAEPAPA